MGNKIKGLIKTQLKIIPNGLGDIMHILNHKDSTFNTFEEAYFTKVNYQSIKGWNKHLKMTLNLVVPVGSVLFYFYDDRKESPSYHFTQKELISSENYCRLTVPPGIWVASRGISEGTNLVLNIADIVHDDEESLKHSTVGFSVDLESI